MWKAGVRSLGGVTLTVGLLAGMGSGIFHVGQALAGTSTGMRRADMGTVGVDMMPVGTARQVDRLKRMRLQKP